MKQKPSSYYTFNEMLIVLIRLSLAGLVFGILIAMNSCTASLPLPKGVTLTGSYSEEHTLRVCVEVDSVHGKLQNTFYKIVNKRK